MDSQFSQRTLDPQFPFICNKNALQLHFFYQVMSRSSNYVAISDYVASSRLPTSRKQPIKPPSRPLDLIFAEHSVKENNLEYQQLLIRSKELQIQMGGLQAELGRLQKQKKKAEKLAEEATRKKETAQLQLREKQFYLQRYYDQLDKKFRGGRDDLFAGLKRLENNLLEMYKRDEKRIKESLRSEREELLRYQEMTQKLRQQRDRLREELYGIERVNEANIIGQLGNQKDDIIAQNEYLKAEIEKLVNEKKNLQAEEKILKKILNVEEQHKKHGGIIASGIRKVFSTRVKEQRYKEAVAQDYSKNIVRFRQMIAERKGEYQDLLSKLQDKNKQLANLREENQQKNRQYSMLEDELLNLKQN